MQVRVGQRVIAVVVVVHAVAAVEVVVVAVAGEFVEAPGGFGELARGHADLGRHFFPRHGLLHHTRFQPGRRNLAPRRYGREWDLGYRQVSADDVAVERSVVGDQPARDMGDAGSLALDHGVAEIHVRGRFVDEPFASAVDDELRGHHAFVEHELHAAVRPLDRREPPGFVEQVRGGADLLRRADTVAHRRRVAEAPVLVHLGQQLLAQAEVVVEPTRRQDHTQPRPDPL